MFVAPRQPAASSEDHSRVGHHHSPWTLLRRGLLPARVRCAAVAAHLSCCPEAPWGRCAVGVPIVGIGSRSDSVPIGRVGGCRRPQLINNNVTCGTAQTDLMHCV
jgi:hypothetical protein